MAQPLEQKKRQKILVGILVAVVIMTAIAWSLTYYKEPAVEPGQLTTGSSAAEEVLKTIKLDFSVFDDDLFKSLKSHGVLPVTAGETGRTNPFEQF